LTTGEVQQVVEQFVAAAERAETAGFDGVEVHAAHGYLVCQFLDGRHNQRTDGYGGELADRSRMLFEILQGIRARTGPSFQVGLRLTPEGNGITLPESVTVASQVLSSGLVDYLDMSLWDVFKTPNEPGAQGLLIDHFTGLERGTTRLGVAGKILTAADVRWCLEHGADFVTVGTGAILHHDFPKLVAADVGFMSTPLPVSRDHLRAQMVGDTFVAYLASGWDDFVA
jgi:2,4-dienoyl-CoA reductase-like NADH-dependent reductase (Old Yellow Enzyme family)